MQELLQEAEQDESEKPLKMPKNYYNLPKRKHSRHQKECGVGTSTTRGGSLQNLHALGMEGTSRGGGKLYTSCLISNTKFTVCYDESLSVCTPL